MLGVLNGSYNLYRKTHLGSPLAATAVASFADRLLLYGALATVCLVLAAVAFWLTQYARER